MLAEVFQRAAEAIVVINIKGRVTEANSAFERLTEYSGAALTGHDVRVMVADRTPASQLRMVRRQLLRNGQWKGDLWIKTCTGRMRPVWLSLVVVRDDQGKGSYIVISAIETSELRRAEKRILHMAHHDPLTHLPIPRLIRVTIDEAAPPDFVALDNQLKKSVSGASLDTHRRWEVELTRMARALSTLSYAILALICISAIAMVIFATRTVLDANRQTTFKCCGLL